MHVLYLYNRCTHDVFVRVRICLRVYVYTAYVYVYVYMCIGTNSSDRILAAKDDSRYSLCSWTCHGLGLSKHFRAAVISHGCLERLPYRRRDGPLLPCLELKLSMVERDLI